MPHPRKQFSAAEVSEGKRLYETTRVPISEIAIRLGVSYKTLAKFAKDKNWRKRRRIAAGSKPRRRDATPIAIQQAAPVEAPASYKTLPADPLERTALAARIQGVVEREIEAVESILATIIPAKKKSSAPPDAERAARTLASLARTLTELARLEFSEPAAAPAAGNDDVPRDLEELRRALARKLADFTARRHPVAPDDSGGA